MKRYMAVSTKGSNSGIQTKCRAVKWAENHVSQNNITEVWITEVQFVVKRIAPPIELSAFVADEDEPIAA